jgi:polysaccharide export outer membrane protein
MNTMVTKSRIVLLLVCVAAAPALARAQSAATTSSAPVASGSAAPIPSTASPAGPGGGASTAAPAVMPPDVVAAIAAGVAVPADYVIGPEDVLQFIFWREKDLSVDGFVRPDGKVSIPLLNDVQAAGLTPEQLTKEITVQAQRYVEDPNVTVIVKQINSRKVYVVGQVPKTGAFVVTSPLNVLQLLAIAGGVLEYADAKNIHLDRTENGKTTSYRFNYDEVIHGKNLAQNIMVKPGDTIVVP